MGFYKDFKEGLKSTLYTTGTIFLTGAGAYFWSEYKDTQASISRNKPVAIVAENSHINSGLEEIAYSTPPQKFTERSHLMSASAHSSKPETNHKKPSKKQINSLGNQIEFYEGNPLTKKMGQMLYGEGRGCKDEELIALGFSVMGRANDNLHYNGKNPLGVLKKPWAYSCFWEKNKNAKETKNPKDYNPEKYLRCLELASGIISEKYANPLAFKLPNGDIVNGNLYHEKSIAPFWKNKPNVMQLPTPSDWKHRFYAEFPSRNINELIIHTTEIPLTKTLNWFGSKENKDKIRSHYIIDESGNIIYYTPEAQKANHCKKHNQNSIGIEVVGTYTKPISGKQFSSLITLIHQAQKKYNIPDSRVYGHYELDPTRRKDPGKENMRRIREYLKYR